MSDDRIHDPERPNHTEERKGEAVDAGSADRGTVDDTPSGGSAAADDGRHGTRPGWGRRELFKAMASVPVLGTLGYGVWRKNQATAEKRRLIFEELGVTGDAPAVIPNAVSSPPSDRLRLGIVGYGGRGQADMRGAGFAPTEWTDRQAAAAERNPRNQNLATFMEQHDLNLELTAVCDLFDVYAERGIDASTNTMRPGQREQKPATRYRSYEEDRKSVV